MKTSIPFRLVVLVAAMMCALGASAAEAYACYTSSNTTLTFYYDNLRSTRPGPFFLPCPSQLWELSFLTMG